MLAGPATVADLPMPPDWLSWLWANREEIVRLGTPIIGLIGGVIGISLLYIRTRAADRTARAALEQAKVAAAQARTAAERHDEQTTADRERRITESFAKAVEQLGSDKPETRLGGIYTLERIARESEREYWPIMETLTAYVREHAPWPPRKPFANPFVQFQDSSAGAAGENTPAEKPQNEEQASVQIRPTIDIQAILTVLGRRDESARRRDKEAKRRLDLGMTDLRGATLRGAHLEDADLWGAHLERADLMDAHLEDASLWGAHLEGARLLRAHLERASLWGAHLERASLWGAHLERANLMDAHLEGAHLENAHLDGVNFQGANLRGAYLEPADLADPGLTQEQLKDVKTLRPTRAQRVFRTLALFNSEQQP